MNITRSMLRKAVDAEIISAEQAIKLGEFIKNLPEQSPSFTLTNVLYYFGGLIAIGALTLFMTLGWELYGGGGVFLLSLSYAVLAISLAALFRDKGYVIPSGIFATFAICLTPLAVFGLQRMMGWWPDDTSYREYYHLISWRWLYMELATLIVGIILARIFRYPFMIFPIALTLWYLTMDLTSIITGSYDFVLSAQISMYMGFIVILIAFWVDIRSTHQGDYAFWLYLFGVLAFWGGLSCQHSYDELSKFIYLCINLVMILAGVILSRKVFVLFGALGVCYYLGHLAFKVFAYSYLFPVILAAFGLGIVYLGILWQKHEQNIALQVRSLLPQTLRELLHSKDEL